MPKTSTNNNKHRPHPPISSSWPISQTAITGRIRHNINSGGPEPPAYTSPTIHHNINSQQLLTPTFFFAAMSEFKAFKKADLAKVAKTVGISVRSKDTKQLLLEKIEAFVEEFPERARELIDATVDDEEEVEVATLVEVDATEDESDDDDEEIEVEVEEEIVEDEDDEDKDYNAPPPINLKEWIVDPAIGAFESAYNSVLQFTDEVGITTLEANDDLREHLSRTVTLNYLELAVELGYFLYFYVPLVAVKDNRLIHQVFKDNIPVLKEIAVPVPDLTALLKFNVTSILVNWSLYAVLLPLLVSYYVNFTRRVVVIEDEDDEEDDASFVVRLHKYDPFIFALTKVLIFFFIFKNGALTTIDTYKGIVDALKNHLFIQLGIYHRFVTGLGNFPLVVGIANVVISLYAQFEDY